MVKLTDRAVTALKVYSNKESVVWDEDQECFGVRIKPTGAKSWIIQYRNKHGQSRRMTLGKFGRMTATEAGKEARKKLVEAEQGGDPASERAQARNALTVSQLCDEYLKANANRIKPSTLTNDRGRIERHIKPLLGSRPVRSLTPKDIEGFVAGVLKGKTALKLKAGAKRPRGGVVTGGPGAASRALDTLGTVLERAVRDGEIITNPARKIPKPKSNSVKPPFSFAAVKAIGKAMRDLRAEGDAPVGLDAVRFLLLSGFRRMEGLKLKRGAVDTHAHCARLPDTKSGPQTRPLGQAALDHLAAFMPKQGKPGDYVFPGTGKAGHYVGAPKAWDRMAARAGIEGVSLHGLRHYFASAAAEMNYSELAIAGLLGHSIRSVTGRYATTPDAALILAADRISQRLAAALDGHTAGGLT